MSFSGAPQPPDPTSTSAMQQSYNTQAAKKQQALNMIGQNTPFAAMQYVKDPSAPGKYRLQYGFAGPDQQNYGTLGNLAGNTAGMYSQAPNLDPSQMTNTTMAMEAQYLQPWFKQQNDNMAARLQNMGFAPGSEGYTNAMRGLTEGQQGTMANTFLQAEPMAFNQAVQNYQLPMQTEQGLMGMLNPGFQQTPQAQVQPPNYAGLAENNYDQQMKQYQAQQQGMWGIPTAMAGGWARAGFPGAGAAAGAAGDAAGSLISSYIMPALMGGGMFFSDERVKDDIVPIGELHDGTPVVSFRYKGDMATRVGLLAQDVEKRRPDAVKEFNGIKAVDYGKATERARHMAK